MAFVRARFVAELRDQDGGLLRTLPARDVQLGAEHTALKECKLVSGVYVIQVWCEVWRPEGGWARQGLASETWP